MKRLVFIFACTVFTVSSVKYCHARTDAALEQDIAKKISDDRMYKSLSERSALGFDIPADTGQLIIISTESFGQNAGRARLFEWTKRGAWRKASEFPCYIGENGFSEDALLEGRRNTPIGLFGLGTAFGTGEDPGAGIPYRQSVPGDVWEDDPESDYYNTWQQASDAPGKWRSAENMHIPAYALGFVIGYNTSERIPYAGSAFFFHIYEKPTYGCVGVTHGDALHTLRWLDAGKNPGILMGPIGR